MSYCPKDGQPCCDDLCRGSGCMSMHGAPLLDRCTVCGQMSDGENFFCACDEDEYLDDNDGFSYP